MNIDEAFALLSRTVEELGRSGRMPTGAGLKVALLKQRPDFAEGTLGFASFGRFLAAAQQAGRVRLERVPGRDIIVFPQPRGAPEAVETPRVRHDLFQAFMDVGSVDRFFDPASQRALLLPKGSSTGGDRTRYLRIEPVPLGAQVEWRREFTSTLGDQTFATELVQALNEGLPMKAFGDKLRSRPDIFQAWVRFRTHKVAAVIRDWLAKNGLVAELFEQRQAPTPALEVVQTAQAEPNAVEVLRAQLIEAIRTMPAHTLLSLPVPAGLLLPTKRG